MNHSLGMWLTQSLPLIVDWRCRYLRIGLKNRGCGRAAAIQEEYLLRKKEKEKKRKTNWNLMHIKDSVQVSEKRSHNLSLKKKDSPLSHRTPPIQESCTALRSHSLLITYRIIPPNTNKLIALKVKGTGYGWWGIVHNGKSNIDRNSAQNRRFSHRTCWTMRFSMEIYVW